MSFHSNAEGDEDMSLSPEVAAAQLEFVGPPSAGIAEAAPKRGRPVGSINKSKRDYKAERKRQRDKKAEGPEPERRGYLTRDQLVERVAVLEAEAHGAKGEKPPAVSVDPERLAAALAGAFAMLSQMASRFAKAPEVGLSDDESRQLGMVWEPVLAPLIKDHSEKLLWLVPLGVTANIMLPKIDAAIERKRQEKQDAKKTIPVVVGVEAPRGVTP